LAQKGSLYLTRPSLAHYLAEASSFKERATKVLNWVADGTLKVRIERVYPMAGVAQAYHDLEGRKTTGKLLVEVS
jgi:NADPH2:quinone reductase